jgi:hypothetical protein
MAGRDIRRVYPVKELSSGVTVEDVGYEALEPGITQVCPVEVYICVLESESA